jgi:hypothetical protein
MKRLPALASIVLVFACGTARAGALQDQIDSRWRGAWVLTAAETWSDCQGFYNDNRVNGRLVSGRGRLKFRQGELARVDSIDLKRSRLDLRLTFAEPVLVSRQDGPFTLYDEASCRVEMQVELPREVVKGDDLRDIETLVMQVLDRHAAEDEARAASTWNRRRREPYPGDYQQTLQRYAAWKAEQANAAVQAALDRLVDETSRIPDRINGDPDYMAGFVKGIEAGRSSRPGQCQDLVALSSPPPPVSDRPAFASHASNTDRQAAERQARAARGYQDGQRLALGLDAVRRLPGCFAPVPGQERPTGG